MADRIGVIAHGRLIAEGTLDDLRRQVEQQAAQNGAVDGAGAIDGDASLEDTFLALVAESAQAA
jgi:ABC-2 type transport system ATP-binding protein